MGAGGGGGGGGGATTSGGSTTVMENGSTAVYAGSSESRWGSVGAYGGGACSVLVAVRLDLFRLRE